MENGKTDSNTATVCGEDRKVTVTLVNGFSLKRMGTGPMFGLTEIDMKVFGTIVWNMGEELIYLQMGIITWGSTSMESLKDKEHILGLMGAPMLEVSKMEWSMALESGEKQLSILQTFMKDITSLIKWFGKTAVLKVSMLVTGSKAFNMAKAKWPSQMVKSKKAILKIMSLLEPNLQLQNRNHLLIETICTLVKIQNSNERTLLSIFQTLNNQDKASQLQ